MSTLSEKDEYGVFADHIAAELRSLSPTQAGFAKRKLARALVDIMDEAILMVSVLNIYSFLLLHFTVSIF